MPASAADHSDLRVDPLTGDTVYIVRKRQQRPNLPESGCPFCVGGLEAPEPYDVRWFKNRWPALPDGLAEVVLYSPESTRPSGSSTRRCPQGHRSLGRAHRRARGP
ncbi:MAG: hypothetical protein R2710_07735 [Acidimicrobiales bacterium]